MKAISIGGTSVAPGQIKEINIPIAKLYDYTPIDMPVKVIRGKEDGPVLFICAALHGDEFVGVEILKRILNMKSIRKECKGTLIAVPIVNLFGFMNLSRYLPDRRDLNRSFPGSTTGPLASRLANIFVTEIVSKSTHGIDLHTAAVHRKNFPQLRAYLKHKPTKEWAKSFEVPVILDSGLIDGSLRKVCYEKDIPLLVFEGGEALRYNEVAIRSGVTGVLSAMKAIGMLDKVPIKKKRERSESFIATSSYWVRAPHSGGIRMTKKLGAFVKPGELLGSITNPFGEDRVDVRGKVEGIIVGQTQLPLVNKGDALLHIATFKKMEKVLESLEQFDTFYDDGTNIFL